ncbi:MAG: metallophosphoesterase [Candidatus Thorarchaeota archaeon]|nr:metallophosphoesterase [Candidatus Thorarchaeota archaeon]
MIIAVSDLHLGDPVSNRNGFLSFIDKFLKPNCNEISELVLLGDILDLWRRNTSSVIHDNLDILKDVCNLGFQVHYIVGNHDFIMKEFGPEELTYNPKNMTVSDGQVLTNGGSKFRFVHGHQMSYWYALPFYEAFSRAMCIVNEEIEDASNVWTILQKHSRNLSPFIIEQIHELSEVEKAQIDKKLAGPLIGHSSTIEESLLEDYKLLQKFVNFKEDQAYSVNSLYNEMISLSSESGNSPKIESLAGLGKVTQENSFEELASKFLNAWIGVFQWMNSGKKTKREEIMQLVRRFQRIALMFSTNLDRDEFVIHGHGHSNHVDFENQIADSGCWIGKKASFIQIDEGKVSCTPWPIR